MNRLTRLAAATAAAALTLGLAAAGAHAEDAPPALPVAARLGCRTLVVEGSLQAACQWRVAATGYGTVELWRGTGADGALERVKVFETDDHSVTRYVDADVEFGTRYGYVLIILGPEGNARARSNIAGAGKTPPPEVLALACARAAERTVHCEWGAPSSASAATLSLWGIANNSPRRELTTQTPAGAGSFDLEVPNGTWTIHLAVVAYDDAGKVVGKSPAVVIRFARPRR